MITDWKTCFELDADRYVKANNGITTECAAIPETMTLAEAATLYAITGDWDELDVNDGPFAFTLIVNGEETEWMDLSAQQVITAHHTARTTRANFARLAAQEVR